jgi:L-ribulokinase
MAHLREETYTPIAANHAVYKQVYGEYVRLHDLFGRPGGDPAMKTLKKIKAAAKAATVPALP